jgi:hypothetical protein
VSTSKPSSSWDYDTPSFEAFSGKASRYQRSAHNPKLDKSTQSKLDSLADQTERLSRTNLALTGLLKRALHFVPSHLQSEYYAMWDAIKQGAFVDGDIHP